MGADEVFGGWTDAQLRGYLAEAGRPAPPMANRQQLIDTCVEVATAIESQVAARRPGPPGTAVARAGPPPVPHPLPPPNTGRRRKALIVGINYFGTRAALRGCINDARCMHYLLTHRLGFAESEILMMTDDHPDPLRRPTRANMTNGFVWLMSGLTPGTSLFFHYSGHGSQQRDPLGFEADGLNETLCPLDFQYAGEIVDDELNGRLVNPLPQGVKLHAVVDACHSGSVLDLPYTATCHHGYLRWETEMAPRRGGPAPYKGTSGGFAVQFSASQDSQTAADTAALSGGVPTGAATFAFLQALERRGLAVSYGDLLIEMYSTLQRAGLAGQGGGGGGGGSMFDSMLGGLVGGGAAYRGQEPTMSANWTFDLNHRFEI